MPRQRREAEIEERRRQIVAAAADIFHTKGYRAATLDDVAEAVGVTKAALYYYVSGKRDLLWNVYVDAGQTLLRAVEPVLLDSGADPVEKLRRVVHAHVDLVTRERELMDVFFREWRELPAEKQAAVREYEKRYVDLLERTVAAGIAMGLLQPLPPRMVVFGLLGMLNWLVRWYRPGGPMRPEEIADVFLAMVCRGLVIQEPAEQARSEAPLS